MELNHCLQLMKLAWGLCIPLQSSCLNLYTIPATIRVRASNSRAAAASPELNF